MSDWEGLSTEVDVWVAVVVRPSVSQEVGEDWIEENVVEEGVIEEFWIKL